MNMIFKLMIFSILLNFSVGLMSVAIPAFGDADTNRLPDYDSSYADGFIGEMNGTITPSGLVEDKGNAIYRVLDMLNIGFIAKILNVVDQYLFGFVNVLQRMFGDIMAENLSVFVFGIIKGIMTIGYILGAWSLWTGKDIQGS